MTLPKQLIRQLRSLAQKIKPTLWIGKSGVTDMVIAQADETLEAHELIKCVVQDGCMLDARQVGEQLSQFTDSTLIQVIGRRVVLYRRSMKNK